MQYNSNIRRGPYAAKGAKGVFRGRKHEVLLREPDAGNPHVRFDKRDVETERLSPPRHFSTRPRPIPIALASVALAPLARRPGRRESTAMGARIPVSRLFPSKQQREKEKPVTLVEQNGFASLQRGQPIAN